MITLFDIFKRKEKQIPKEFEIGDYVYCDSVDTIGILCDLNNENGEYCIDFNKYDFCYPMKMINIIRHATTDEIEDYETKKDIQKYNL